MKKEMTVEKGYFLKKEYERLYDALKTEYEKLEDKLPSIQSMMKDTSQWNVREDILRNHDHTSGDTLRDDCHKVEKELSDWIQWIIKTNSQPNGQFCLTSYLTKSACVLVDVLCENRIIQTERERDL